MREGKISIDSFITNNNLKSCDIIIAKRKQFGFFKHYIVYKGMIDGEHYFIGNFFKKGIVTVNSDYLIEKLLPKYKTVGVKKYRGIERAEKLNLIIKKYKKKPYNLFNNNCKHFALAVLR